MKLIVTKPFSWAHFGVQLEHFEAGAEIETDDPDLIEVSLREEWAAPAAEAAGQVHADAASASARAEPELVAEQQPVAEQQLVAEQQPVAEQEPVTEQPAAPKRGRNKQ